MILNPTFLQHPKKQKQKKNIYVVLDVLMIGLGGINKTGKKIF